MPVSKKRKKDGKAVQKKPVPVSHAGHPEAEHPEHARPPERVIPRGNPFVAQSTGQQLRPRGAGRGR